jgi:hypothetical protein
MRLALCFWLLAIPAMAQLDSYTLRSKYGAPLNRETYKMSQGFDLVVDYGAGNQACKLEMPAEMPPQETASGPSDPKQQMQDFLLDLVPAAMRGKELNRMLSSFGAFSVSMIMYEHLMISETHLAGQPGRGETITVNFKDDDCH